MRERFMVRRGAMVLVLVVLASGCFKAFDFDQDSKADAVAFTNGAWVDLAQPAGGPPLYGGSSTDIPVPGDYDGNGRVDVAVVHPNGDWVTQSSLGSVNFPAPAQLPAYTPSGF